MLKIYNTYILYERVFDEFLCIRIAVEVRSCRKKCNFMMSGKHVPDV